MVAKIERRLYFNAMDVVFVVYGWMIRTLHISVSSPLPSSQGGLTNDFEKNITLEIINF